jgi:lipoic acid synthetase/lipoate-protein ligase A
VRQRITLMKDYTTMNLDQIKQVICDTLCSDERRLTASEVVDVERLERSYLDNEFVKLLQ